MTGWIGDLLPATGAAQVFGVLLVSVLLVRLFRYFLRLLGLGA